MRKRGERPVLGGFAGALTLLACLASCSQTGATGDSGVSGSGGAPSSSAGGNASGGLATGGAAAASGGSGLGGAGPGSSGGAAASSGGSPGDGGASTGSGGAALGAVMEEAKAALPLVRQEHGAASLGGEVYVLGGFVPEDTASVQAYSPATDAWRDVADFPALFHHPNVAVVGDLLYVLGFHLGGGALRIGDDRSFAYDPTENEWLPRAPLPEGTGRGASCVAVLGTKVYVFGGSSDPTVATSAAYDTELDLWDELPDLPEPRDHCLAAGMGDRIYIVGGRDGGIADIEEESWAFDPASEQFEPIEPLPTLRAGVAGGVLGGRLFVAGGEGNEADALGVFHEVESYDPIAGVWTQHADLLTPRHGFGGAVLGDRLYLPGGATAEGFAPSTTSTVLYLEAP